MATPEPIDWKPKSESGALVSAESKRRLFEAIKPPIPFAVYESRLDWYMQTLGRLRVMTEHFGEEPIPAKELEDVPDNSARFEKIHYSYRGLDAIREQVDAKRPVVFVSLHHGALWHRDYALCRAFPEVTVFANVVFQYGRNFSYPMGGAGGLSLMMMRRRLTQGRPVCFYLDGIPVGKNLWEVEIFGFPFYLSRSLLEAVCGVEGCLLVPTVSFYRQATKKFPKERAVMHFLDPLRCDSFVADPSGPSAEVQIEALGNHLLEALVKFISANGPAQILVDWLLQPGGIPIAEWGKSGGS